MSEHEETWSAHPPFPNEEAALAAATWRHVDVSPFDKDLWQQAYARAAELRLRQAVARTINDATAYEHTVLAAFTRLTGTADVEVVASFPTPTRVATRTRPRSCPTRRSRTSTGSQSRTSRTTRGSNIAASSSGRTTTPGSSGTCGCSRPRRSKRSGARCSPMRRAAVIAATLAVGLGTAAAAALLCNHIAHRGEDTYHHDGD